MKAIIPVAGVGSRLRPHTHTLPKVLLNVAGKPIIGHIMDKLLEEGIHEAVVIIGYLGDMIQEYLIENYKEEVTFTFVEQEERKGLAHAIWMCKKHVDMQEEVFIILGDTIFEVNLKDVLAGKQSALGVKTVEDPRRFGVAVLEDKIVSKLVEKPEQPVSNLALVGLYSIKNTKLLYDCLDYEIQNDIRTKGEFQLTDALQLMIEKGEQFTTFPVEGWYDCGKPETLLETNEILLHTKANEYKCTKTCVIHPPVFISPDAKIENSIIGPYATIASKAVIKDAIIKNSIVGKQATVSGLLLDHSIVGTNAILNGNFRKINVGDSSEVDFH